jgi:hypothetical protein
LEGSVDVGLYSKREAEANHDKCQQTNKAAGIRLVHLQKTSLNHCRYKTDAITNRNRKLRLVSKLEFRENRVFVASHHCVIYLYT